MPNPDSLPLPLSLIVRPLSLGDLDALAAPSGTSAPSVQRLRDSHHAIARLIADGKKGVEISAITGYSQTRISVLRGDPAFAELVEFYRLQQKEIFAGLQERLGRLGMDAVQELQRRVDEKAEELTPRELMEMIEMAQPQKGPQGSGAAGGGTAVQVNITFPEGPQGPQGPSAGGITIDQAPSAPSAPGLAEGGEA